jgi:lipopolysaccharide/colanic/teichoic acid biosynthesis glycosyltransferase
VQRIGKRLFDIFIATTVLLVLFVPILLLAFLIRVKLGHPVLFRQMRPGLGGVPFEMVKFRTMTDECGPDGALLPDAERMTSFGAFLRSYSLDELPQLWNIIKGDMSLVGPRPLIMDSLRVCTPEQARRLEVQPGITGWAQVNGRNSLSWDEKFKHDVWYVDHWSFWLDIRILWRTVGVVLGREHINAPGHATGAPMVLNAAEKTCPPSARTEDR